MTFGAARVFRPMKKVQAKLTEEGMGDEEILADPTASRLFLALCVTTNSSSRTTDLVVICDAGPDRDRSELRYVKP